MAQAQRAHRHQLRAQAAAPRPRGPRAASPARTAPAPGTRRAAPAGGRGRGRGRRGRGLGRRSPGSSAARTSHAVPWKETESRPVSALSCPAPSPSHLPGRWPAGGVGVGAGPSRVAGLRGAGPAEALATLLSRARAARVGHRTGCTERRGGASGRKWAPWWAQVEGAWEALGPRWSGDPRDDGLPVLAGGKLRQGLGCRIIGWNPGEKAPRGLWLSSLFLAPS